ncbi:MAG TPA: 2'-5' RNA ligase family protein [Thermoanaerobaculia bacterium]|nr:2'-5' RNA ligase family protein [Thermoanaerobaculia bacterium]
MYARREVRDPGSLRPNRDPGSPFGRASAFAALLALGAHLAACATGPVPQVAPSPVAATAHPGGSLFSTIPCAPTPLGREWASLREEAAARFPGLRLTTVEDLHITVVYVGPGWKVEDLGRIRTLALVAPREAVTFRPEVVRFGRNGHVVVVELLDVPESWAAALSAAKAEMNRLGLKKPEAYDAAYRPHVTLASARNNPPGPAEEAALEGFRSWIAGKAAAAPARFTVTVAPDTPIRLWLAGTARPPGAPEYVDLADVLSGP